VDPAGTGPPAYNARVVDALHGLLAPKRGESLRRARALPPATSPLASWVAYCG